MSPERAAAIRAARSGRGLRAIGIGRSGAGPAANRTQDQPAMSRLVSVPTDIRGSRRVACRRHAPQAEPATRCRACGSAASPSW